MKVINSPRKIIAHPHRVTGLYASQKNGKYIAWESQLERDTCILLEHDPEVVTYESQSKRFEYNVGCKTRIYTPDFYVQYMDNHDFFLEVKAQIFVSSFKDKKSKLLEEIEKHNIPFKIITEVDIRCGYFLQNIKFLERFNNIGISEETFRTINALNIDYITVGDLSKVISLAQIYCLIYKDFFEVDINSKIIDQSSIVGIYND